MSDQFDGPYGSEVGHTGEYEIPPGAQLAAIEAAVQLIARRAEENAERLIAVAAGVHQLMESRLFRALRWLRLI